MKRHRESDSCAEIITHENQQSGSRNPRAIDRVPPGRFGPAEPGVVVDGLYPFTRRPISRKLGVRNLLLTRCSVCEEQRDTGEVPTRANRRSSPADNMKHFPARIGRLTR